MIRRTLAVGLLVAVVSLLLAGPVRAQAEPAGDVTSTTLDLPRTVGEAEQLDDGTGETGAPWLIGSGVAAIVLIAGGGLFLKRRSG